MLYCNFFSGLNFLGSSTIYNFYTKLQKMKTGANRSMGTEQLHILIMLYYIQGDTCKSLIEAGSQIQAGLLIQGYVKV